MYAIAMALLILLLFIGGTSIMGSLFESVVLNRIPEYVALSAAVKKAETLLEELNSAAGGGNVQAKLADAVLATATVADLKAKLAARDTELAGVVSLQAQSTETIAKLNKAITYTFNFDDTTLVGHLDNLRDSMVNIIEDNRKDICVALKAVVPMILSPLTEVNQLQVNSLCTSTTQRRIRTQMEANMLTTQSCTVTGEIMSCSTTNIYDPVTHAKLVAMLDKFETLISYAIAKKFCVNGVTFDMQAFKNFVITTVDGLCDTGTPEVRETARNLVNYLVKKPATYL